MKKYWPLIVVLIGLIVFYLPDFGFANSAIPGAHTTIFPQKAGMILICLGLFLFFFLRVFRRFSKKKE